MADLITQDIRRKRLRAGAPYMTSDEVGKMLNVHKRAAGRAMALLAQRNVLVNRRGVGSFVGSAITYPNGHRFQYVHVLVSMERLRDELPTGELIDGMLAVLPGYDIQINVLPLDDPVPYAQSLLDKYSGEDAMLGIVLLGCPREVHELVAESTVPAVVFGGLFAGVDGLLSADTDSFAAGELVSQILVSQNPAHRIALFMRESWLPGDCLFLDGINESLHASAEWTGSVLTRATPMQEAAVKAVARDLLAGPTPPTAMVAIGARKGEWITDVVREAGLAIPDDCALFVCESPVVPLGIPGSVVVAAAMSYREQSTAVAEMLKAVISGETPDEQHQVFPVACFAGQ